VSLARRFDRDANEDTLRVLKGEKFFFSSFFFGKNPAHAGCEKGKFSFKKHGGRPRHLLATTNRPARCVARMKATTPRKEAQMADQPPAPYDSP
jgi:hypothetical protein